MALSLASTRMTRLLAAPTLLGDFSAGYWLWGSIDEDERERVIRDLVVLNTHTHWYLVYTVPCTVLETSIVSRGGYLISAGVTISRFCVYIQVSTKSGIETGV
jgi:hypothetical protein